MANNLFVAGGYKDIENSKLQIQSFLQDNPTANPLFFNEERKTIWGIPNSESNNILEFGGTIQPIMEKEYTYKCEAANEAKAYIYFLNIHPTSNDWATPWQVHYTLTIKCDTSEDSNSKYCHGEYDVYVGCSGSNYYYHIFNKFYSGSYYPLYYHKLIYHNTEAKYNNRASYPAKAGASILSAWGANTRTRTYTIKVYDTLNCTTSFPDNIETHGVVYNSANYNVVDVNGTSTGLQETGDSTDITTMQLTYGRLQAGINGIKMYSLIMQDSTGKWQSFVTGTGGTGSSKSINSNTQFRLGSRIYYVAKSSDTAANEYIGNSQLRAYHALVDFRYSFPGISDNVSNGGLTYYKPIFIVGSLDSNGYFKLDSTKCWTQDEPTSEDGKIYIKVGLSVYPDYNTSSMPNGNYRADLVSDGTPWHYYKGKFQVYYGTGGGGSSLQNMVYNSGIKLGEYLDEDENPHNIYTPEPLLNMAYNSGIRIGSYITATGNKNIFIPEPMSTIFSDGTTIGSYKTSAGTSNIWIPIKKVASMPSTPSNDMIYIVSDMANGTTNPDTPGSGANDYVTNAGMEDYINSQSFITLNVLNNYLNTASYISSIPGEFVQQSQLDESAYITQNYLDNVGYVTSSDIEGAINTAYNNSKNYTDNRITSLINGAPSALDTLSEIASALNNNPNMGTALINQINSVKTDLNSYVKSITLNGSTYNPTSNNINLGNVITSHASHKLNVTNSTPTNSSASITFVESLSGNTTASSADLTLTATRKTITIPSVGTLKTDNTTSQTPSAVESFAGPINLHKVSKTGKYSDLIDTPTPVTESTVSGWGFTKNAGTLTGVTFNGSTASVTNGVAAINATIPSAVTESTVSSWGFTKNAGTITGITMNGASKGTSGVINLGTVLTAHQDISGKQDTITDLATIRSNASAGAAKVSANNSTITIQKGGTNVDTFTTNASSNKTINIPNELPSYSSSDSGKILSVDSTGALVWITPVSIYSGTGEPLESLGIDGDIYVQN